ncbi:MAG: hypothetical protein ACP5SH_26285 [Syntrophobacteraceae bacterium]
MQLKWVRIISATAWREHGTCIYNDSGQPGSGPSPPAPTQEPKASPAKRWPGALFSSLHVEIIGTFQSEGQTGADRDLEQRIVATVERRPCTVPNSQPLLEFPLSEWSTNQEGSKSRAR